MEIAETYLDELKFCHSKCCCGKQI